MVVHNRPFVCPNPDCAHHRPKPKAKSSKAWYAKMGHHATLAFGTVQRYHCLACGKTFSDQTFRPDYWLKKKTDFKNFDRLVRTSSSGNSTARSLELSWESYRNRLDRLAEYRKKTRAQAAG